MYLENELNYKTSTDYKKLYMILHSGVRLIGFIDLGLKTSKRLQVLRYEQKAQMFDFGFIVFFDADFDESKFEEFCTKYAISYIPLDWYREPKADCILAPEKTLSAQLCIHCRKSTATHGIRDTKTLCRDCWNKFAGC